MRGTALGYDAGTEDGRITPACAGNRPPGCTGACSTWDHPRVCGEQSYLSCPRRKCRGSPPRVRGTGFMTLIDEAAERITPACAGNRELIRTKLRWREDHPRVCGEQLRMCCHTHHRMGSPPRVRGTDTLSITPFSARRITPACAGNSFLASGKPKIKRDHPRVCGEQARTQGLTCIHLGSPPRVRGTGRYHGLYIELKRITPACAGNRQQDATVCTPTEDHPRVCGEQACLSFCKGFLLGSPPRVRGTEQIKHP